LFAFRDPWTLPKFMHAFMSHVAAKTSTYLRTRGVIWQDTYYETRVTTARQFGDVAYYIEQNPVKKQLVERPEGLGGRERGQKGFGHRPMAVAVLRKKNKDSRGTKAPPTLGDAAAISRASTACSCHKKQGSGNPPPALD
jgi:hypothetical protein